MIKFYKEMCKYDNAKYLGLRMNELYIITSTNLWFIPVSLNCLVLIHKVVYSVISILFNRKAEAERSYSMTYSVY